MEKINQTTLFNYDAYMAVIAHVKAVLENPNSTEIERDDANDEADLVSNGIQQFTNYVKIVDDTENHIKLAYVRYDGEQLRTLVESADKQRRYAHEAAIASVKILNRIAKMASLPEIFTGDANDRFAVADFCLDVTNRLFQERTK